MSWLRDKMISRNRDSACFLYAIAASYPEMLSKQNRTYPAHYKKFISQFNVDGIEMPMAVADVPLFEEQNSKLLINNFLNFFRV